MGLVSTQFSLRVRSVQSSPGVQMIEILKTEFFGVVGQVNRVYVPSDFLSIWQVMEITHAFVHVGESAARTGIARFDVAEHGEHRRHALGRSHFDAGN